MTKLNSFFVIAAGFVLAAFSLSAQTPTGCVVLQDGTQFCPAVPVPQPCCGQATPPAPVPINPCCLAPLAERITKDAAEAAQVVKAMDSLRATPSPANPGGPSFGNSPINPLWLLLGLALIGGLVWFALRNRRPQQQGTGQVEGNFLTVRHPLQVTASPLHLNATVGVAGAAPAAPAPAQPVVGAPPAPAAVGTPCPGCGTPKPTLVAQFCANCGHALPLIMFVLLLAGFGQTSYGQTANDIRYRCVVNAVEGLCTPPAVTIPAPQAPKPAVRRNPRPASAVPATLTADEIRRAVREGVAEGMKASVPSSPPAPPTSPATTTSASANQPAAASVSSVEALARRLGETEVLINETRKATNTVATRVSEVQNRLTAVETAAVADRVTLGTVGAAVVTRSSSNACAAYKRLIAQKLVSGKGPKGCTLGE